MILLADISPNVNSGWIGPLLQLGVAGVMLWWFMFKYDPRMKAMESAIDRISRAILLLVVSMPSTNSNTKIEAEKIGAEIDEAEKRRIANN